MAETQLCEFSGTRNRGVSGLGRRPAAAELALGDLGAGGAGDLLDDLEALGQVFLRGARGYEEVGQLGELHRPAVVELDEGADALAEDLVGHRDDGGEGDAGVGGDLLLDLGGADVLAAADDDVGGAADDGEVALLVELDDVGVEEEAVGGEELGVGGRVVEVAEAGGRALGAGLAAAGRR